MQSQIFSKYDILEVLERAYESLIRSSPDHNLIGYETIEDAQKYHNVSIKALQEKIIEYKKLISIAGRKPEKL